MIVLPIFLLLSFPAWANDFSFSLEARTGLRFGLTNEYVYEGNRQISRLEWDENFVPYIHTALNFYWRQFFVGGAVSFAIPVQSGEKRNFDYFLPNSNALTHFSRHNAFLDRHNNFDISFGYKFDRGSWFIRPSIGFTYSNRKWTGMDGYLQYAAPGTALQGDEPIDLVTGPVITYELRISYFYAAIGFGYRLLNNRLTLGVLVQFNPYIWAEALDHHILRATEFLDIMHGGIGGRLHLTVSYKPRTLDNFELFTGFTFEKLRKTLGNSARRSVGVNTPPAFVPCSISRAGYDSRLWGVYMGIRVRVDF